MEKIFAKFWEGNNEESNLTVSVRLCEQDMIVVDKIRQIQKEIIRTFETTRIFYDSYDMQESSGLFKYPEDRLHFSLVNFLKCKCDFEKFKELTKLDRNYKEMCEEIKKIIKENLPSKTKVEIRSLYDGNGSGINSFVLQIYPELKFLEALKIIENKTQEKFKDFKPNFCNCNKDIIVKGFPRENPKYFPINILRFISLKGDKLLKTVIGSDVTKIDNIVNNINRDYFSSFFNFNISKIILIESDPFLCKWNRVESFNLSEISN